GRRGRKRWRGVEVNALALELLGVAKEYLGPAAPAFLSRELHAMGVNANNVDRTHILTLAERARVAAARVMDNKKAGEFAQALALLGVAVELAPADLAAHRRFAAALANQGDLISACQEYGRFIDVALGQRDTRRAWLELTYGRETLGDLPQLLAIADRVAAAQGGAMPTPPPPVRVAATPSTPAGVGAPDGVGAPAPVKIVSVTRPPAPAPAKRVPDEAAVEAKHRSALAAAVQARTRPEASSAVVLKNAETITHAERSDLTNAAELLARAGLNGTPKPRPEPVAPATRKGFGFTPRPVAELEAELAR